MMKLNFSNKILITAIITFIIILVLDVVFTKLLLNKIYSINDKVKQLEISSQEREKELNLRESVESTKLEREKLSGYFVGAGEAETLEFTKYLENLALEMGVTQKKSLDYEAVGALSSSDVVSAIRYRFNVSGKWANVYSFLQAVENLPKVAYLSSVSFSLNSEIISPKEAKTGSKIWSADLDFSVVKLKN
jgi:hypothetical protein